MKKRLPNRKTTIRVIFKNSEAFEYTQFDTISGDTPHPNITIADDFEEYLKTKVQNIYRYSFGNGNDTDNCNHNCHHIIDFSTVASIYVFQLPNPARRKPKE